MEGLEPQASMICALPLLSDHHSLLVPSRWSRSPEGQVHTGSIPSMCVSPPAPSNCTFAPGGCRGRARGGGSCTWSQHTHQSSRLLLICCLYEDQHWPALPNLEAVQGLSHLHCPQMLTPLGNRNLHPSRKLYWSKRGWSRHMVWARACAGVVTGNHPEPQAVSTCFPCTVPKSKHVCVCSSRAESRGLTPLL